jgi:hypothetical protein
LSETSNTTGFRPRRAKITAEREKISTSDSHNDPVALACAIAVGCGFLALILAVNDENTQQTPDLAAAAAQTQNQLG